MKKALEILKNNQILQNNVEPNYLKKAIEELEALQNRSCENCNSCINEYDTLYCEMFESEFIDIQYKDENFSYNKWESK